MDNLNNLPPNIKLQILAMLGGDNIIHRVNNNSNSNGVNKSNEDSSNINPIEEKTTNKDNSNSNGNGNGHINGNSNISNSNNKSSSSSSNSISIEEKENNKFIDITNNIDKEKLSFFSFEQIKKLENRGYLVIDNYLGSRELMLSAKDETLKLYSAGDKLREAGMSRGEDKWNDSSIRSDLMMWLNKDSCTDLREGRIPNISQLLQKMDGLRVELDEACSSNAEFKLSQKTQSQLAIYKSGGRYIKHKDSFVGGNNRKITCIYYLNSDWKPEDGGQLRLHLFGEEIDIDPIGDRLLIFLSEYVPHEVLVSNASTRIAITTWFY